MVEVTRTAAGGWTLEIERWPDLGGIVPDRPIEFDPEATQMADLLPRDEYDDHHMRVAVSAPGEVGPSLLVALGYRLFADALLVPETRRVFVGGGTRVMAYHLGSGRWWRDWERTVEVMFWGLARHGDMVVMLSELELAAWSVDGEQRWSTWVEPPWGYEVQGDRLHLDVMGSKSVLDLRSGLPVKDQGDALSRFVTGFRGFRNRD